MLVCAFTADMTDDELKESIHQMYPMCQKMTEGFTLTISGYDNDPRELWEIPEVIKFCKKLIDLGFPALLKMGGGLDEKEPMPGHPGFGVLEIWLIATGRIQAKGNYDISKADYETALKLVLDSNVKIKKILAEPCPDTGIEGRQMNFTKKSDPINEGSHRHRR